MSDDRSPSAAGWLHGAKPGSWAGGVDGKASAGLVPEAVSAHVVIDTNVVLDLFVFDDAAARELKKRLLGRELLWVATQPMRDELERVLDYAHIVARMAYYGLRAGDVLADFDRHAVIVDVAARALVICRDPDDQKFIDLAVHHQCLLLSKDRAVLALRKRLMALAVNAQPAIAGSFRGN